MDGIGSGIPDLPPPYVDSTDLSDVDSTNSSHEELEVKEDMCLLLLMALSLYITTLNSFRPIKFSRENHISMNPNLPMNDLLSWLLVNPSQFKDLTNFTLEEFNELCVGVLPTIEAHARSTRVRHKVFGRSLS